MATAPSSMTLTCLSASSCCAQVLPSSSALVMKHVFSATGCPSTPPSSALMYLTAICAPLVASGPIDCWPPCWLIQPMVTGGSDESALPALPPM